MRINTEIFHKFFHPHYHMHGRSNANVRIDYFNKNLFYSYRQLIGQIIPDHNIVLINRENFSATTTTHRNALIRAVPGDMIKATARWDSEEAITLEMFEQAVLRDAEYLTTLAPHTKKARDEHSLVWQSMEALRRIGRQDTSVFRRIENILESVAVADKAPRKGSKNGRKAFEELADSIGFLRLAALKRTGGTRTPEQLAALRYLRAKGLALVYVNDVEGEVRTTEGVSLPIKQVKPVLRRYMQGRVRAGAHVGVFEVNSLDDEKVTIGCHQIPVGNIRELAGALNIK